MKTYQETMAEADEPFIPSDEDCQRCRARGKTWRGSHPKCAFKAPSAIFTSDNWNCATASLIRLIGEKDWYGGEAWPETWWSAYEDQFYGVIDLRYINGDIMDGQHLADMLAWASYKHHGCFEQMWLLGNGPPRYPTLTEVERIIGWFERHHPEIFIDDE